jgi:hypothetical protein
MPHRVTIHLSPHTILKSVWHHFIITCRKGSLGIPLHQVDLTETNIPWDFNMSHSVYHFVQMRTATEGGIQSEGCPDGNGDADPEGDGVSDA